MSHLLHFFPLISLQEITPITDAYQWMHITIYRKINIENFDLLNEKFCLLINISN